MLEDSHSGVAPTHRLRSPYSQPLLSLSLSCLLCMPVFETMSHMASKLSLFKKQFIFVALAVLELAV